MFWVIPRSEASKKSIQRSVPSAKSWWASTSDLVNGMPATVPPAAALTSSGRDFALRRGQRRECQYQQKDGYSAEQIFGLHGPFPKDNQAIIARRDL